MLDRMVAFIGRALDAPDAPIASLLPAAPGRWRRLLARLFDRS